MTNLRFVRKLQIIHALPYCTKLGFYTEADSIKGKVMIDAFAKLSNIIKKLHLGEIQIQAKIDNK